LPCFLKIIYVNFGAIELNKITLKSCRKNINAALKQAGPRYTPALDKMSPNLHIAKFENLFDSLFQKGEFIETLNVIEKKAKETLKLYIFDSENSILSDQEKDALCLSQKNLKSIIQTIIIIRNNIGLFHDVELNDILEELKIGKERLDKIIMSSRMRKKEERIAPQKVDKSDLNNNYEGVISSLRDVMEVTEMFYIFLTEYGSDIHNKPFVLIYGEAGIGKTHTLCDLALRNVEQGAMSVITLAENLNVEGDILENIVKVNGYNMTVDTFLKQMSDYAKTNKMRSLLIVDAINDSSIQEWEKQLKNLIQKMSLYKGIGLVLSCRTPYEKLLLTKVNGTLIAPIKHFGFRKIEFDAQQAFFKWKKVPAPEVPLLEDEYSNPLFLKLFTESLSFLHEKKHKSKELNSICSGQKSMTFILEQFYERVGGSFVSAFSSKRDFCWLVAKEVADVMSAKQRDYINPSEFNDLKMLTPMTTSEKDIFIKKCCSEGMFIKTCIYEGDNSWVEVIKFPYQKVSDHLIARSILKMELTEKNITEKKNALKQGFLGKIFCESNYGEYINLAEAIMLEFPIRDENKNEIFDLLDWKKISYMYCESFIRGLAWRPINFITKRTSKYLNLFLKNQQLRFKALDSIITLAVKNHRFNEKLYKWLFSMDLIDRDLFWTEYLRNEYESSAIQKLITWIEINHNKVSKRYLSLYIDVLTWVLSSTNRSLRDKATRSLVYLGIRNPEALLKKTINSLNINDPYIVERMFSASYGTLMRLVHSKKGRKKIFKVNKLIPKIYRQMFCKSSEFATTNILLRDSALGIIELTSKVCGKNKQIVYSRLIKPFKGGSCRKWGKAKDRDENKYRGGDCPLGMDFKNYTLGRLSPTRRNYDNSNNDYKLILQNIWWRIYNLGYSLEKFSKVDQEIATDSWRTDENVKIERYGKKYAWISFFELYGYRKDMGVIKDDYGPERLSDCGVDPSFPEFPREPDFMKWSYLGDNISSIEKWLNQKSVPKLNDLLVPNSIKNFGHEWVLLGGLIVQESKKDKRYIHIYTKGAFISKETAKDLKEFGNSKMQFELGGGDVPSDTYTYAGEIPWHKYYRKTNTDYLELILKERRMLIERIPPSKDANVENEELSNFLKENNMTIADMFAMESRLKKIKGKYYEVKIEKDIRSIPFRYAYKNFEWEYYHSILNQGTHPYVPDKQLAKKLKLYINPVDYSFYNSNGDVVIFPLKKEKDFNNQEDFLFIRKDKLDAYLKSSKMEFIWIIQGERKCVEYNENNERIRSNRDYKQFDKIITYESIKNVRKKAAHI
jgi:hypothetical protein